MCVFFVYEASKCAKSSHTKDGKVIAANPPMKNAEDSLNSTGSEGLQTARSKLASVHEIVKQIFREALAANGRSVGTSYDS